jgi:GNAT superfamily N-acetyltransferase
MSGWDLEPSSALRVRLATPEDADTLARHRAAMFRDMGEADDLAASVIENASIDHLKALVEAREYFGFLVEEHGEIIAGGGAWLRPLLPRPGTPAGAIEAYVLNVYTEPGHRRRGLAKLVMGEILRWCRERRVARVVLHASKEGLPLYEALGFEQTNEYRLKLG